MSFEKLMAMPMINLEASNSAGPTSEVKASLIRGNGEMADLIRRHAWEETELGSIEHWPPELLSFVNLMLASREIMTLFWGPDRLMIYNEHYVSQLGSRHPALGQPLREVWPEVVDQVSPFIDTAFEEGQAAYLDNSPLTVYENGEAIQRVYTASFEPIWVREDGAVRVKGVHQVAIDNTLTGRLQEEREKETKTLHLAQQVAEIACWQWDLVTEKVTWVGDTRPLFGVPAGELRTAEQILLYVHPDDLAGLEAALQPVLAGDSQLNFEHRVVHADGSIRWLATKGSPIIAEDGKVCAIVGANTNVTNAREAQLAVLRTKEQLALALEAVNLATWFYDPARGVVGGDSRMAALFGLAETEGPAEIWIAKIHPEDQERVATEFGAALAGEPYDTEYRVLYGDTTRWVRARAHRSQEDAARLFGVCEDVTARNQIEEQRRLNQAAALRSEEQLTNITDALPAFISYLDHDLRYQRVNKTYEEWFSRPAATIVGKTIDEVLGVAGAHSVREHLQKALSGERDQFEYKLLVRGQERTLSIVHLPDRDANGVVRGVIVQGRDVTDQKRSEEALIQNEKLAAVGRLASSIAHEINNPLEAVTNLIFLAKSAPEVSPETLGYLDVADRELRRASNIASQTLRFHKQSSGPVRCTGRELFAEVLSVFQGRIINSHIEVEERYQSGKGIACFDGDIRQVLSNLIGNAIDAMPKGGRLVLRSRCGTDQNTGRARMVLTVADTGTGMSQAVQRKIFEAFYSTKGIGGTGLGLWISKEIVERHHGSLRVRSSEKDEGSGTVFTLSLPEGNDQVNGSIVLDDAHRER